MPHPTSSANDRRRRESTPLWRRIRPHIDAVSITFVLLVLLLLAFLTSELWLPHHRW